MLRYESGFTLIETLVALLLLLVGMLALLATTGIVARDFADATMLQRARVAVRARVEALRATACTSASGGLRSLPGGSIEQWTVTATGLSRTVSDAVHARLTRGRSATVVESGWVLCRR